MMLNDKTKMDIFAKNLRFFMAYNGISQTRLANTIGVNQSSVSAWVKGESLPRKKHLNALCRMLNISEEELFDEKNTSNCIRPLTLDEFADLAKIYLADMNEDGRSLCINFMMMLVKLGRYRK